MLDSGRDNANEGARIYEEIGNRPARNEDLPDETSAIQRETSLSIQPVEEINSAIQLNYIIGPESDCSHEDEIDGRQRVAVASSRRNRNRKRYKATKWLPETNPSEPSISNSSSNRKQNITTKTNLNSKKSVELVKRDTNQPFVGYYQKHALDDDDDDPLSIGYNISQQAEIHTACLHESLEDRFSLTPSSQLTVESESSSISPISSLSLDRNDTKLLPPSASSNTPSSSSATHSNNQNSSSPPAIADTSTRTFQSSISLDRNNNNSNSSTNFTSNSKKDNRNPVDQNSWPRQSSKGRYIEHWPKDQQLEHILNQASLYRALTSLTPPSSNSARNSASSGSELDLQPSEAGSALESLDSDLDDPLAGKPYDLIGAGSTSPPRTYAPANQLKKDCAFRPKDGSMKSCREIARVSLPSFSSLQYLPSQVQGPYPEEHRLTIRPEWNNRKQSQNYHKTARTSHKLNQPNLNHNNNNSDTNSSNDIGINSAIGNKCNRIKTNSAAAANNPTTTKRRLIDPNNNYKPQASLTACCCHSPSSQSGNLKSQMGRFSGRDPLNEVSFANATNMGHVVASQKLLDRQEANQSPGGSSSSNNHNNNNHKNDMGIFRRFCLCNCASNQPEQPQQSQQSENSALKSSTKSSSPSLSDGKELKSGIWSKRSAPTSPARSAPMNRRQAQTSPKELEAEVDLPRASSASGVRSVSERERNLLRNQDRSRSLGKYLNLNTYVAYKGLERAVGKSSSEANMFQDQALKQQATARARSKAKQESFFSRSFQRFSRRSPSSRYSDDNRGIRSAQSEEQFIDDLLESQTRTSGSKSQTASSHWQTGNSLNSLQDDITLPSSSSGRNSPQRRKPDQPVRVKSQILNLPEVSYSRIEYLPGLKEVPLAAASLSNLKSPSDASNKSLTIELDSESMLSCPLSGYYSATSPESRRDTASPIMWPSSSGQESDRSQTVTKEEEELPVNIVCDHASDDNTPEIPDARIVALITPSIEMSEDLTGIKVGTSNEIEKQIDQEPEPETKLDLESTQQDEPICSPGPSEEVPISIQSMKIDENSSSSLKPQQIEQDELKFDPIFDIEEEVEVPDHGLDEGVPLGPEAPLIIDQQQESVRCRKKRPSKKRRAAARRAISCVEAKTEEDSPGELGKSLGDKFLGACKFVAAAFRKTMPLNIVLLLFVTGMFVLPLLQKDACCELSAKNLIPSNYISFREKPT